MLRMGILGGTFDPVHYDHLLMAERVKTAVGLDKLIIVPTFMPPHKAHSEAATAEQRTAMLKLAFNEGVEISDYEIREGGYSYTYKTLEHFKAQNPNAKLYFIVGGDMLVDFKTWREPKRILAAAELVVLSRRGLNVDFEAERGYFAERFGKTFTLIDFEGKGLSSTKIRLRTMFGLSSEGEAPQAVLEYIADNALYPAGAYQAVVRAMLPEKRLRHTVNVAVRALEKVKPLGLDREKVLTACTLHDVCKYKTLRDFPEAEIPPDMPQEVRHAFLGEYFARTTLGVTDTDVLNAIKYHTSGRAGMSVLEKLVFVADMIEDDRDYEGVERLRELYNTDFEKCFTECLKEETAHLKNKGVQIYRLTLEAYEYYLK